MPHRTAGCGKSSLRPLMAGSSPSLPDGSNPSAAIVQSASDVQCSRLLKTTAFECLANAARVIKLRHATVQKAQDASGVLVVELLEVFDSTFGQLNLPSHTAS